ncbi:Armadillo-like helical [Corchorus olitorius]|uniref:Armadillo-like helical n=1 Tax=Corchorus olitorius TaxID=93759 RepID=A0A1R3GX14_9ROSI|nr:Armadillo-like helical [Corchorus olitorius]
MNRVEDYVFRVLNSEEDQEILVKGLRNVNTEDAEMEGFAPTMRRGLARALSRGEDVHHDMMGLRVLAQYNPRLFLSDLNKTLAFMMNIAIDDDVEQVIRHDALRFLKTLLYSYPAMFEAEYKFRKRLFHELVYLLCEVEEDEDEDGFVARSDNHTFAMDCLEGFLQDMDGMLDLSWIVGLASHLLSRPAWEERFAALAVLAELHSYNNAKAGEIMGMVLESVNDSNPHVKMVALESLTLLSYYWRPDLQREYAEIVLVHLVHILKDEVQDEDEDEDEGQHKLVKAYDAQTLVWVIENAEPFAYYTFNRYWKALRTTFIEYFLQGHAAEYIARYPHLDADPVMIGFVDVLLRPPEEEEEPPVFFRIVVCKAC